MISTVGSHYYFWRLTLSSTGLRVREGHLILNHPDTSPIRSSEDIPESVRQNLQNASCALKCMALFILQLCIVQQPEWLASSPQGGLCHCPHGQGNLAIRSSGSEEGS